jgi:hypothetical protein
VVEYERKSDGGTIPNAITQQCWSLRLSCRQPFTIVLKSEAAILCASLPDRLKKTFLLCWNNNSATEAKNVSRRPQPRCGKSLRNLRRTSPRQAAIQSDITPRFSNVFKLNFLSAVSLNEGHGFKAAEKLMFCIRARLYRLRKNHCWIDPDFRRTVPAPDFLAAASISFGENGPELSTQPLRLFLATALMFCIRARLKPCPSYKAFFGSLFSPAREGRIPHEMLVRNLLYLFSSTNPACGSFLSNSTGAS